MAKMLNPAQAEAMYSAMVALNNVGGRLHAMIDLEDENVQYLHVVEYEDKSVWVFVGSATGHRAGGSYEKYDDWNAFAAAYELD